MSWETVSLGDVCTLINGRAYKQNELLKEGTPVMRIQNLNGGEKWYYSDLNLPENKYCEGGDLLYAWSGSFGPYIWNGGKCIYHYHIWKVQPKEVIIQQYLFHVLNFITHRVKDSGHGIALLHVTKTGMEDFKIPLPPLESQKRIVSLLDQAQELIDKRKEQIALMDQLIQSLFYDMFGDPVTNPKGWEITNLENTFVSKPQIGSIVPASEGSKIPIVKVGNLGRKQIDIQNCDRVDVDSKEIKRFSL